MMAMTIAATATRTRMKTMPAEAVMRLGGGSFGWFMPSSFAARVPAAELPIHARPATSRVSGASCSTHAGDGPAAL